MRRDTPYHTRPHVVHVGQPFPILAHELLVGGVQLSPAKSCHAMRPEQVEFLLVYGSVSDVIESNARVLALTRVGSLILCQEGFRRV